MMRWLAILFALFVLPGSYLLKAQIAFNNGAIMNYPNPFSNQTTIVFSLGNNSTINVYITDMSGKKLIDLVKNVGYAKGSHSIIYNSGNLSDGNYICILETSSGSKKALKMVKVR